MDISWRSETRFEFGWLVKSRQRNESMVHVYVFPLLSSFGKSVYKVSRPLGMSPWRPLLGHPIIALWSSQCYSFFFKLYDYIPGYHDSSLISGRRTTCPISSGRYYQWKIKTHRAMAYWKTAVTPLRKQWSYDSLSISHRDNCRYFIKSIYDIDLISDFISINHSYDTFMCLD